MNIPDLTEKLTMDGVPEPEVTVIEGELCDGIEVRWGDVGFLAFNYDDEADRITYLNLRGPDDASLLAHLAWAMAAWEDTLPEWVIPQPNAADAFRHIGFQPEGGQMVATPERCLAYGLWKQGDGPEPDWHKELS